MTIKELLKKAKDANACNIIDGVRTYKQLVDAYFSPQGQEFCVKYTFPQLEDLTPLKAKLEPFGVYVNNGVVDTTEHRVAFIGKTDGRVIASGADAIYQIVVQHGANVSIEASNYAVLNITSIEGGNVVINGDNTIIVL